MGGLLSRLRSGARGVVGRIGRATTNVGNRLSRFAGSAGGGRSSNS